MNGLQRPGRAAAVVGGLVAVGAATVMALAAGTASAAEQGQCTDNVNVRAEPSPTARIVAVCERGTEVTVGERRNGFVHLTNLHGWSAEQYVSTNRAARTAPGNPPTSAPAAGSDRGHAAPTASRNPHTAPEPTAGPNPQPAPEPTAGPNRPAAPTSEPARPAPTEAPSADEAEPPAEPQPAPSPVGGLVR
ncbi:SH3 domain-containing protein [Pseudonocardia asaccharolytica]|uniref:SH3b domain-containing protein n=1 Tax=Pseudonocardia asaccharolytica DSM 44247 = NBRC 16224 TaxID=1123024 RepID=A0A511D158_9PSEU|nr:SH3 domain-containing protein [Pseudonocardia asaccharolytica]GEL16618.1 hypothetical protein PA7_04550 [Pseudonocardia asaccharolytica DSM 44247 = NBRC 16224]